MNIVCIASPPFGVALHSIRGKIGIESLTCKSVAPSGIALRFHLWSRIEVQWLQE
jgi:hypothetical protein